MTRAEQQARFQELIAAGALRLDMSRGEVRACLGEPEAVGGTSRKYRTPSIFKYGDVQVFFGPRANDGLTMVFLEEDDGAEPEVLLSASDAGSPNPLSPGDRQTEPR